MTTRSAPRDRRFGDDSLLARVEECIAGCIGDDDLLRTYAVGGKRLRATLVLLPSRVLDGVGAADAVRYASFTELIHAGTLCHDDVVDCTDRRRGRPTVAAVKGSRAATLAGLALMWRAYSLVAAEPREVRDAIARAARRVAEGQADEMAGLWMEPEIDEYLERQRLKTGALFELAAWLGARAVGLDGRDVRAYCRLAMQVGLGFQVADDLRDFVGAPDLGREPGVDLREGVLTLPVLLALRGGQSRLPLRAALNQLRESGDALSVARCRQLVLDAGVLGVAEEMGADLWDNARDAASAIGLTGLRRASHDFVEMARAAAAVTSVGGRRVG